MTVRYRGARKVVANLADEFLSKVLLADNKIMPLADSSSDRAAAANLWGCDFHVIDGRVDEVDDLDGGGRSFFNPHNNARELAEIMWPIDFGMVAWKEDYLFLQRVSTIGPADVRGLVTAYAPKMVLLSSGRIMESGAWDCENLIAAFIGGSWRDVRNPVVKSSYGWETRLDVNDPKRRKEVNDSVGITFSVAFTERYNWHAALGFSSGGPRLVFPTNPKGCLSLFKDRENLEGDGRRAALKHWVNNHYRQSASSDDDLIYVRDHLRGATEFVWNGLFTEVMVSAADLELNEFFRAQAAEWRAARKHNRVHVKLKGWKARMAA